MCFGGKPKQPSPAPIPAPAPTPMAEDQNAVATQDERKAKLDRMRRGLASTIKTASRGMTGGGSDLTSSLLGGGKDKLG